MKKRIGIERWTQKQYNELVRSPDVLYITTDTQRMYLGDINLADGPLSFVNTGEGWKAKRPGGENFSHTDNQSVIAPEDFFLEFTKDTQRDIEKFYVPLTQVWKVLFSNETDALEYGQDYRLMLDSENITNLDIDLVIDTDDPITHLETHQIIHLLDNGSPNKYEIDLSKYDLKDKIWRVNANKKWGTGVLSYASFRWGHAGGFKATIEIEKDSDTNDLLLLGENKGEAGRVSLEFEHDESIFGHGTLSEPYGVEHYKELNNDLLINNWEIHEHDGQLGIKITRKTATGLNEEGEFIPIKGTNIIISKEPDGLYLEVPYDFAEGDNSLLHDVVFENKGTTGLNLLPKDGRFQFRKSADGKYGIIEKVQDGKVEPIKVINLDLTDQVDDHTVKVEKGKLRSISYVYWGDEKHPVTMKRNITQLAFDQLVTDGKVEADTIYYINDTLRTYIGDVLYTPDYTVGEDIPIVYESEWKPEYPSWKPNKYYLKDQAVTYGEISYLCIDNHYEENDFEPDYWTEIETPEGTQVKRVINEGPNDFQIAFFRLDPEYKQNDGWRTEHTFNFKVIPDSKDPENLRGVAQFCVDNDPISWRPGDFVYTDATEQEIFGIKKFVGDLRVGHPSTEDSATPKRYVDGEVANAVSDMTDYTDDGDFVNKTLIGKLQRRLIEKSDKWYPNRTEKDIGDIIVDDKVQYIFFQPNPKVDDTAEMIFVDDYGFEAKLFSKNFKLFLEENGVIHELYNDGTEIWGQSFETIEVEFDALTHRIKFYDPLKVISQDANWQSAWGNRDIFVDLPLLPRVDCEYNYNRIVELKDDVVNLSNTKADKSFSDKTSGFVIGDFTPSVITDGININKIAVNTYDGGFKEYDFPITSDTLTMTLDPDSLQIELRNDLLKMIYDAANDGGWIY
jgi:hypothetical protein